MWMCCCSTRPARSHLGNRQATEFLPAEGVTDQALADACQLSSLADETPEGRSIVVLAKEKYGLRARDIHELGATFIPFTAQTRMSGVNLERAGIRKGSADAIEAYVTARGGHFSQASGRTWRPSRSREAHRWSWRKGESAWASFLSKISSRAGSKSDLEITTHGHQDGDDHRR